MIQSLHRAAAILREVAAEGQALRLTDLVRRMGLNKTTVFHLAETLVAEGLLSKKEGGYLPGSFWKGLAAGQEKLPWYESLMPLVVGLHRQYPHLSVVFTELGESDLFMRFEARSDDPTGPYPINNQTLNPYLSVSGLLHFAYLPEERLSELRLRHPFETKGLESWGSRGAFQKAVDETARRGYSETPGLVHPDQFKLGLPLFDTGGQLRGALTFQGLRRKLPPPSSLRRSLMASLKSFPIANK